MDLTRLRFAAAMMHSVPDAQLSVAHENGVTSTISYFDDADLNPCDWRALIAAACSPASSEACRAYPDTVVDMRFERGFDPIGGISRRTADGCLEFWFATLLEPARLQAMFREVRAPVEPNAIDSGVFGDTHLRVSLGMLRAVDPETHEILQDIASHLAGQAIVAEIVDDGIWVDPAERWRVA